MAPSVVAFVAILGLAGEPAGTASVDARAAPVAAVATAERLLLPSSRRPTGLKVDPLAATIELRVADPSQLAARLRPLLGAICPIAEVVADAVVLRCRTRRLDAELSSDGGRTFLDIRTLRGLPYRGADQDLRPFYDPSRLGAGDACPGANPGSRGECALERGRPTEATLQFRLAIGTPQHAWGALRLGDLALRAGDVAGALQWYQRAGTSGAFGRLALLRSCELTGECLADASSIAFTTVALPEPVATEVALRAARADVFEGRASRALDRLGAVLTAPASRPFCDQIGLLFCRRLVLDLLGRSDAETGPAAVEVYLALPRRLEGPLALELARSASERAAALGAPVFGANVMTSIFSAVGPEEMRDYLLRTAELYVEGRDWARARLVLEYAQSRFEARQISDARWVALERRLKSEERPGDGAVTGSSPRFDGLVDQVAQELAAANAAHLRAAANAR